MCLTILTDAVEDNNGVVKRIADNGQKRCNDWQIEFPVGKREGPNRDEDIVDESSNRGETEAGFETIGNVGEETQERPKHRVGCLQTKIRPNLWPNKILADDSIATEVERGLHPVQDPWIDAGPLDQIPRRKQTVLVTSA